ncbi:MAG TPA: helix-turn-helix domain-containing protein, partial [Leucothrix sp.]|nr:helix-turn-helix domain-containing protein [Leucothrix sp.]
RSELNANSNNEIQWVKLPLSRSEIGALLGLTIETVSRFISDWKRKGYIKESKGYIQIINAEGLKKAACLEGSC